MQRIGKYTPRLKHRTDVELLKELTAELADIRENKWPRVERDDASGKLRIGRASARGK
jgi:hypothetical protein